MKPYLNYRRNEPSTGWTRIDLLLALYDGALERLDKAEAALRAGNETAAVPLLVRVQLIVAELSAGVRLDVNPEAGTNMLRLYEFVANELRKPRQEGIANARKILRTLREGFEGIRAEANELERTGRLPSADRLQMVHATA
jgi:flagellin-specific chaperone FliS